MKHVNDLVLPGNIDTAEKIIEGCSRCLRRAAEMIEKGEIDHHNDWIDLYEMNLKHLNKMIEDRKRNDGLLEIIERIKASGIDVEVIQKSVK